MRTPPSTAEHSLSGRSSGSAAVGGLTGAEAARRFHEGLGNAEPQNGNRTWRVIRRNVVSFFNLVLASLIVTLLLAGELRDGLLVGAVVVANVAIATGQELIAVRGLRRLRALTVPRVAVRRDGQEREVGSSEVVVGDLLVLRRGDQVVADGRIHSGAVEIDEALLTGESSGVRRTVGDELRSGVFCVAGDCLDEGERVGEDAYAFKLTAEARGPVPRVSPCFTREPSRSW